MNRGKTARTVGLRCVMENNPEIISPDVLADDRAKYEQTGDQKDVGRDK